MVAKYHDGYALWPTSVRNPHAPNWHSRRDLVGEVARAVRARGLRFGVYYSGGVDWTFQRRVVRTLGDYSHLPYGAGYGDYAEAQVRELIQRVPAGRAVERHLLADRPAAPQRGVRRLLQHRPRRGGQRPLADRLAVPPRHGARQRAWETTRGMGTSYGYNRQETDAHYASFEQTLLPELVSAVAKNGRLLLNVGPAGGGGRIPPEQRRRLEAFGA